MRRLLLPWLVAVLPAALHAQEGAKPDLPTEPRPLIKEGLGELGLGSFLEEARLEIRGWLAQSFTFNAHHADDDLNTFRLFDDGADRYRFNQLGLLIERLPAEEPGWDLGGGVELLYGSDARFIHSEGLLDDATNATVQFDPVQFFLRARVPVGRGLTFKVGKFITPVGYEEIEAPDNGLFSHSFQFNTQPSTHTGVQIDYPFAKELSVHYGLVQGWDVWVDNNDSHTHFLGMSWETEPWGAWANVVTGPEREDENTDYRTLLDASVFRQWTAAASTGLATNYGVEPGGAADGGTALWWGVAAYQSWRFSPVVAANARVEYFRDRDGGRVPEPVTLTSATAGLDLTPFPRFRNLRLRPEVRWDHALSGHPFSGRNDQLTIAADLVFTF